MAKTTLTGKKKPTPRTPKADLAAVEDVCGSEESALATYTPTAGVGEVAGDIDDSDIKFPRLELVYGVGAVSELFDAGDIVYNRDVRLASKGNPVVMTVASLTKYYMEVLPFDPTGETRPRLFQTKVEVQEAGLWIDWRDNQKPPVSDCATLLVVLECPEDVDDSSFPMTFTEEDGTVRSLAVAQWVVRNTSYTRVAKQVISAQAFFLRGNLLRGRWELRALRQKSGDFVTTLPAFRCLGTNSDAYQAFLQENLAR